MTSSEEKKQSDLNCDVISREFPTRRDGINGDLPPEGPVELKRTIGLLGGVSFIVGAIIGSGIFVSPTGVVLGTGSYGLALIIWAVSGIMSLCFAFAFAELGTMLPLTGGTYVYLNEGIHPVVAFLRIFVDVFVSYPGSNAVIAMTSAKYFLTLFVDQDCGDPFENIVKILAVVFCGIAAYINMTSATAGKNVQIIFTASKVLVLIIIIVGGLVNVAAGSTNHLENSFSESNTNAGDIILAIYGCLWAYSGWNSLNFLLEELTDPLRNLPLAILISMPLVTAVYLLTNISYFLTIPPGDFKASSAVASTWAGYVMPDYWWLIPIGVGMSTYGAVNGSFFTIGRYIFSISREGHLPKILSMIHVHTFVPQQGILLNLILSVILIFLSDIGTLIDIIVFTDMIFYGLVFAVCIHWRWTKKNLTGVWKAPLLIPYWALLFSIFVVLVPVILTPSLNFLYGILSVFTGLVFYIPFIHFKLEIPGMDYVNAYLQLWCKVCPPENTDEIMIIKEVVGGHKNVISDITEPKQSNIVRNGSCVAHRVQHFDKDTTDS